MADNKNLNPDALNENDLENVSGGVADWRNEQARAADRDRAGRAYYSKNTKNGVQSKNIKNTKNQM